MKMWIDLTDRCPIKFDVARMTAEIEAFEAKNRAQWLDHYDKGLDTGWRAILLASTDGRIDGPEAQRPSTDFTRFRRTELLDDFPYFREILDRMKCPQGRIRILKLAPGAKIGRHRDRFHEVANVAMGQVRLHVPIITNEKVFFHVNDERIQMAPGRLYYVNFSREHHVRNDGTEARLHLVMDLKVNDWLRSLFPNFSLTERIQHVVVRRLLPWHWKYEKKIGKPLGDLFWRKYNGSVIQRAMHSWRARKSPVNA